MCPEPDPISNSAVKHTSAHGTVSHDTGESVAARPAQHKTHIPSSQKRRRRTRPGAREIGAGWSSPVARQAHNLKVAGSNPAPATKHTQTPTHNTDPPARPNPARASPRPDHAAKPRMVKPGQAAPGQIRPRHPRPVRIRAREDAQPAGPSPADTPRGRGGRLRGRDQSGSAAPWIASASPREDVMAKSPAERPMQKLMLCA